MKLKKKRFTIFHFLDIFIKSNFLLCFNLFDLQSIWIDTSEIFTKIERNHKNYL